MSLPVIINSAEEMPEGFSEHYTQQEDGKFLLSVDAADTGYALEDVSGLKSALQNERNGARALNAQLQTTQAQYQSLQAQLDAAAAPSPATDGRAEQLEAKLVEAQNLLKQREAEIEKTQIETHLSAAFNKANLVPHGADLLAPHIRSRVAVVDGAPVVLDAAGNVRISANADGTVTNMSVDALLSEMKEDAKYASVFQAQAATGSGARTGAGPAGTVKKFADMSLAEKSALYIKDPAAYERLRAQN